LNRGEAMFIETKRLVIRGFLPEDAAELHEILGDPETMRYAEPPYYFEKTKDFLASFCIAQNGALAAVSRESGKLIGYILFKEYEKDVYEMGWFFNRAYWRQGYAFEACRAVIDYAFEERKARRIFAETADPVKSVGLMKKLGMLFEGVQSGDTELYLYGLAKEY